MGADDREDLGCDHLIGLLLTDLGCNGRSLKEGQLRGCPEHGGVEGGGEDVEVRLPLRGGPLQIFVDEDEDQERPRVLVVAITFISRLVLIIIVEVKYFREFVF